MDSKNIDPNTIKPIWIDSMGPSDQIRLKKYRLEFNWIYFGSIFFNFVFILNTYKSRQKKLKWANMD